MNCKDARHAVVLDHYGELDEGDRNSLAAHLRECPACAADRDETRQVLALVSAAERAAPGGGSGPESAARRPPENRPLRRACAGAWPGPDWPSSSSPAS